MQDHNEATQPDQSDAPAQNPMADSIKGYRKFDQATSDFINQVKETGDTFARLLEDASKLDADPRAVALARTHFQEGAMWLIRAAAKPEGLF